MTGYGRGVIAERNLRATVEVRTVNHRFLDLKLRGAPLAPASEDAVQARVRARVERGSVVVSVNLARDGGGAMLRIDPDAAKRAYDVLAATAAQLGIAGPELGLVLAQPGVVGGVEDAVDDGSEQRSITGALDAALVQLDQMRATEGEALAAELVTWLDELVERRTQLAELAATLPQQVARRLTERVRRLLDGQDAATVDRGGSPRRSRCSRTARMSRRSWSGSPRTSIRRAAWWLPRARSGRRLDVQEIGRELNTIGSKSALAEISSVIVEAKAALEKIREQVQNVE
ncbi:MAG: DUF1732 domain-containing protein [Kofleriaceae bacterium]